MVGVYMYVLCFDGEVLRGRLNRHSIFVGSCGVILF